MHRQDGKGPSPEQEPDGAGASTSRPRPEADARAGSDPDIPAVTWIDLRGWSEIDPGASERYRAAPPPQGPAAATAPAPPAWVHTSAPPTSAPLTSAPPAWAPPAPAPPGAGGPRRGGSRRALAAGLLGTAAVLVAVLLVAVQVAADLRDDRTVPATAQGPGAGPTPAPSASTRSPAATPRAVGRAGSAARPPAAPTWPLPRRCFRDVTRGRAVTAADRRQLGADGVAVAAYRVRDGALGSLRSGRSDSCHTLTWRLVRHLYPEQALDLVDRFVVFERPPPGHRRTGTLRSLENTLAYVATRDPGFKRWTLAVSLEGLSTPDLAHTLVHELGHLLSLGPRHIDTRVGPDETCRTYRTGDRCLRAGSMLAGYVGATWSKALLREWSTAARIRSESARQRALLRFYERNSSRFVGPYAATEPDEDFAESFAYWCLGRSATAPPFTTSALRAKARFLAGRRELRGLRERCTLVR